MSEVLGGLLLGVVILSALVVWSIRRHRDPDLHVECDSPIDELMPTLSGLTLGTALAGNKVEVHENGAFFDVLIGRIQAARESVHFETFLWKEGALGRRVADALIERARAGAPTIVSHVVSPVNRIRLPMCVAAGPVALGQRFIDDDDWDGLVASSSARNVAADSEPEFRIVIEISGLTPILDDLRLGAGVRRRRGRSIRNPSELTLPLNGSDHARPPRTHPGQSRALGPRPSGRRVRPPLDSCTSASAGRAMRRHLPRIESRGRSRVDAESSWRPGLPQPASTADSASCATTSVAVQPPATHGRSARLPSDRRPSGAREREAPAATRRPFRSRPTRRARTRVRCRRRRPLAISGMVRGRRVREGANPPTATATPSTPPMIASATLSVSSCRATRLRVAPSAVRRPISRSRVVRRLESSVATFATAINSIEPDRREQHEQRTSTLRS